MDRFSKNFKFNLKNNVNLYEKVYEESGRAVNSKNLDYNFVCLPNLEQNLSWYPPSNPKIEFVNNRN